MVLVADSSFAVLELLSALQRLKAPHRPVAVVTRLRKDARLYEPAPPPPLGKKSRNGRPPLKGKRLSTLQQRLHDPQTQWTPVQVPQWYGSTTRSHGTSGSRWVEIATDTAIWYHTGKPPVPLRWVLVCDLNRANMAPAELFRRQMARA